MNNFCLLANPSTKVQLLTQASSGPLDCGALARRRQFRHMRQLTEAGPPHPPLRNAAPAIQQGPIVVCVNGRVGAWAPAG